MTATSIAEQQEKDPREMTLAELHQLREELVAEAQEKQLYATCAHIAEVLGYCKRPGGAVYFTWESEGLSIYYRRYPNSPITRVTYHDRPVLRLGYGDALYVPGEWERIVFRYASQAKQTERVRQETQEERDRVYLLDLLGYGQEDGNE